MKTDTCDNATEFKHDALGRVVKTIYPSVSPHGPTYTHVGYDSLGRRTWQSEQTVYSDGNDPNIIGKEFEYDDTGRLRAVILPDVNDPCNSDTPTYPRYEYDYDKYGNLTCIRDNIKQYADDSNDYNDVRETSFTYGPLHNQISRRLPDGRIEFKQYDNLGRLKKSTDFAAQITGFDYDARGQLQYKKFYTNDTLYTYDEPNQLYQYTYDTLGRNLAVDVNDIDAMTVDTYLYDYDDQGQITEVNTPQGTIYYDYNDVTGRRQFVRTPADGSDTEIEYTYDALGRVWDVNVHRRNAEAGNEVTRYEYSPVGLLETIVHKVGGTNILTSTYSYDALNRLISLVNKDSSQSTLSSYTYTLAAHGAHRSVTEADGTEITWDYDNLNRLIEEDYNAPGSADDYTHEYIYDLIGNRLKRVVSGQPNTIYVYDPNNDRLVQETSDEDTIYYFYDDNGSLIEVNDLGSIRTYTYDFANKLAAASDATTTVDYKYDPDGIRVRKVIEGGVTTDYLIDPYNHTGYPQVFIEKPLDANNTAYIIGSDVIAQADSADVHYFLYDGHGSVRQLANSVGNLVSGQAYNYDAYGNLINSVNPSTNLLYTGEWRDSHLGWDYLRARWYDPPTGRLNRIDPFPGNSLDPLSLHKYTYVHNSPTNGVDPSGRFFSSPYHGGIVHAEIGAHFIETSMNDRLSNRRINTILKTKVKWWGRNQPDLVDRTTTEVWEIKPLGTYRLGKVILGWYLYLLNTYDPLERLWKPGATYTPPSVVQIDAMSFAFVFPPIDGVIEYEVFDVRPAIAFVIAVEMYRLKAHLEMAKIRMVGLRIPF